VAIYLTIIGPCVYFFLKRIKRLPWVVWVEPLIVVVYVGLIFLTGYLSRGVLTQTQSVAVYNWRENDPLMIKPSFLGVFSSEEARYRVTSNGARWLRPAFSNEREAARIGLRRDLLAEKADGPTIEGISIFEYLDFFAGAYRISTAQRPSIIDGVLELTDLTQQRDRMFVSLSKGMKQRLCLAKTLIHDPRVLILDEPASAMDPRARIELRDLLKELSAMGKTILISSHILTELSDISTAYGIIERGKILEWGSMEKVKNCLTTVTRVHMRFHERVLHAIELLESLPDVRNVDSEEQSAHFDYTGEPESFHEILRLLVDRKLPLLTVEHERSDLESLFLEVTRGELQ
jgi:ABC-2 type transport system ATP-binding protein